MKKFIQFSAIFFGLLMTQNGYSQNYDDQSNGSGDGRCCPAPETAACCQPADSACGEQWVLMCHQQPCYYKDWKCVEKQVPCTKKCVRYVPKYYEVEKCRYVPEKYKETYCRYEKECYEVAS